MQKNITICPMSESTLLKTVKLLKVCLPRENLTESSLKKAMRYPHNFLFIAKINENICGFIDYSIVFEKAYLNNIAVSPPYRRKKVASHLMNHMLENCVKHHVDSVSLEVRILNFPAINLYSSFGFVKAGVRKNLYSHPTEDALIMNMNTVC